MRSIVKALITASLLLVFGLLTGCTTLANRRDLYFPQTVEGPYTRMMRDGIPRVNVQPEPAPAADYKATR